jgi:hypothetical protein
MNASVLALTSFPFTATAIAVSGVPRIRDMSGSNRLIAAGLAAREDGLLQT